MPMGMVLLMAVSLEWELTHSANLSALAQPAAARAVEPAAARAVEPAAARAVEPAAAQVAEQPTNPTTPARHPLGANP
jgi:hypothetical protein